MRPQTAGLRMASLQAGIVARLHNRRFLRHSGLLMLANVITTALGLMRTLAVTWLLPREQVGMLGVLAAWTPFLSLMSLPGVDAAAYHYVAKGQTWAFHSGMLTRLRWSLLSASGFLVSAGYWFWQGEPSIAWLFIIAGLTFPVVAGLSGVAGALAASEHFTALFWYRITDTVTSYAGFLPLLLGVIWLSQSATYYTVNQLATAAMQIVASLWLLRRLQRAAAPPPQAQEREEMLVYGRHQTGISSISIVQSQADTFLIGTFFPLTTVADFAVASVVGAQLRNLWGIYANVRYPPLVRTARGPRRARFVWEGTVIWFGFIAIGVAVYFAARLLIPLLLPASYAGSIPYVAWVSAAIIAGTPGGIAEMYFRTEQDQRSQYQMRTLGAVVNVAFPLLTLWLTTWGAPGIMAGRVVANLVFSAYGGWLFWVRGRVPAGVGA